MRTKWLVLLMALLTVAVLGGCGSGGGGGGSDVAGDKDGEPDVEYVGISNCAVCHETITKNFTDTLDAPVSAGMNERSNAHGNDNSRPPSNYYGNDPDDCNTCHDPAGDGDSLAGRPVTTCEGCHGGGSAHRGVGPIPYPQPDIERCASCHNAHGNNIDTLEEDFELTSHATQTHGSSYYCQRCHTYEGALAFGDDYTGNRTEMRSGIEVALVDPGPMQCGTCHDEHFFGFRIPAGWSFGGDPQFDLCTSCHTLLDPTIGDDWVGENSYHEDRASRTIADTHYDDPATDAAAGGIEGYVVRNNGDSACSDCHDVHATDRMYPDPNLEVGDWEEDPDNNPIDINRDWAESGHAGRIALVKENGSDPFYNAVTSDTGDAWVHYDWDATTEYDEGEVVLDRGECQECHTATGVANYLDDPDSYDPLNNDFSHLDGWSLDGGPNGETVSSPQNELLYCWGCHSNVSEGTLRNPGAISRPYEVDGATVVLPDIGNSNVCVNCHGARGNVEGYELSSPLDPSAVLTSRPGFGGGTKNVTEAHYLTAAATIYQELTEIGYMYPGGDYDNDSDYEHDQILEDSSGPCAGCHMQSDKPHVFDVVDKTDDTINAVNSTICTDCHAADVPFLQTRADGYHEALQVLEDELINVGLTFSPSYPYFGGASWVNEGNFGAAHNFNYLHHEPGAYAHNTLYAKRLIFDSIDWVDNYSLDGTIDLTGYPDAADWFDANSITDIATRP